MRFAPLESVEDIPKQVRGPRANSPTNTLLRDFMESGAPAAQLDLDDTDKPAESIRSSIENHAKRHGVPVKAVTRAGALYLQRTDLGDPGNGEVPGAYV